MSYCEHCGHTTYERQEIIEKEIKFSMDGKIHTATAKAYNDAFYEITKGEYKGALVHIWDIIKQ